MSRLKSGLLLLLALAVSHCATSPYPQRGGAYMDVKGPNHALATKGAEMKSGQSCAQSILGAVAWGDASIESAAKEAGIQTIAAVDYQKFGILAHYGVYVKTCTIVSGL